MSIVKGLHVNNFNKFKKMQDPTKRGGGLYKYFFCKGREQKQL